MFFGVSNESNLKSLPFPGLQTGTQVESGHPLKSILYPLGHSRQLLNPDLFSNMLLLSLISGHIISGYRSFTKGVLFKNLHEMHTFHRRCIKCPRITRYSPLDCRTWAPCSTACATWLDIIDNSLV